jgi:DNA-binding CsgD family transcriptional regulator
MDQILSEVPAKTSPSEAPDLGDPGWGREATVKVTNLLLGGASMEDLCAYCVEVGLSHLHPQRMSIFVIDSDGTMRVAGSFEGGREQQREGGEQVMWPIATAHRLVGALTMQMSGEYDADELRTAMNAITRPLALALDAQVALMSNTAGSHFPAASAPEPTPLVHPSLLGRIPPPSRPLSLVEPTSDRGASARPRIARQRVGELTGRQRRVLHLMAQGMTNSQIARVIAFSESTVRQDTIAIYRILSVKGRAEAIARGRMQGLITD